MKWKFSKDSKEIIDRLFVNPNGSLCYQTRNHFLIFQMTIIDVYPVIDGIGADGRLININDFHYKSHK